MCWCSQYCVLCDLFYFVLDSRRERYLFFESVNFSHSVQEKSLLPTIVWTSGRSDFIDKKIYDYLFIERALMVHENFLLSNSIIHWFTYRKVFRILGFWVGFIRLFLSRTNKKDRYKCGSRVTLILNSTILLWICWYDTSHSYFLHCLATQKI